MIGEYDHVNPIHAPADRPTCYADNAYLCPVYCRLNYAILRSDKA